MLNIDQISAIFEAVFFQDYRVCLMGGADEPFYLPIDEKSVDEKSVDGKKAEPACVNKLYFTQDYLASALHEIAHWCVASKERLKQKDWGYWYAPDGRNAQQQHAFEQAEYKNQAVEWFFSIACGYRFQVSLDNLAVSAKEGSAFGGEFKDRVHQQALTYCEQGLPERAEQFCNALMLARDEEIEWAADVFCRGDLDTQPVSLY